MGMEEIFSSGAKSRLEGAKKIYPLKRFLPPGHNKQEGRAEYLIMAKERLVLASAPYAPHNSFFIRGTFRGAHHMHPLFDLSGAYAPYAPWLHTPMFLIFSLCIIFRICCWLPVYFDYYIHSYCSSNYCIINDCSFFKLVKNENFVCFSIQNI